MKTIGCCLIFIFLTGCTAFQSEPLIPGYLELDFYSSTGAHRGMYDAHTYISTYSPNLKITVDPAYQYTPNRRFGKLRHQFLGADSDIYIHYYPFTQMDRHDGVRIESVEKLLWGNIPAKDVVDKGVEELGGYNWEYCIWISSSEDGCLMTKDTAVTTVDQDILFLRYVEVRKDIVCEQLTNRDMAVAFADWAHALKGEFHKRMAFERIDLNTFGLGLHPKKKDRRKRLNDDNLITAVEYSSDK